MCNAQIMAFAGSTRKASFNKKLVAVAAKSVKAAGAQVTLIDLDDFPLPIFDEDYEAEHGTPENAAKLKQLFIDHNGLLIASPAYNSSVSAVLKNVIDWNSRRAEGEPMKVAFSRQCCGDHGNIDRRPRRDPRVGSSDDPSYRTSVCS